MPRYLFAAAAGAVLCTTSAWGASCEGLAGLDLEQAEITTAESVAAGAFRRATGASEAALERMDTAFAALPAFCRVAATARPSHDSAIALEVWMPADGWNGKLQAVGNGGWAGSISYQALADALAAGYATTSTDTGHQGSNADFVPGHPEKLVDFAHRAVHVMAVAAKDIVTAHYETGPSQSYFVGCSTGGRQALATAQRYPGDFDGIVAGAPANYPSHLQGAQIFTSRIGHREPGAVPRPEQLAALNAAVLAACDTLDGVADGVLENPAACRFDPAALVCSSADSGVCLSEAQAETVRRIYAGPQTTAGESLFPGLARGSELRWETRVGPEPMSLAVDTYRLLVFDDPAWDYRDFDAERDIAIAAQRIGPIMNSTDANLAPFFDRGGKLLLYHGWNDSGISPFNTIAYYRQVRATVDSSDASMRLFMVPGMNHCRGGVGTDRFDAVSALDAWVTRNEAPDSLHASRERDGQVERTRPLCPYPEVAVYDGSGSINDASNFSCALP